MVLIIEYYKISYNYNRFYVILLNVLFYSKWICDSRKRTRAMPHIKSYCRISPCCTEMAWFLLTSANLSKAAWGRKNKSDGSNYIMSHEAGVLFLPQFLVEIFIFLFILFVINLIDSILTDWM